MTQNEAITPTSEQSAHRALGVQSTQSVTKRYSVLVLDTSGSMRGTPLIRTKQAAVKFCEQVLAAEGDNYVAVVSFNTSATTVCNFSNDLNALTNSINALYYTGSTSQHAGLVLADTLLENVNASGAVKNIVLMSDGLPETGAYSYNGPYTYTDYSYGYYYANAAYNKANELKTKYSIYSLGFFHSLSGNLLSFGRRFMDDLQNAGYYEVINPDDLDFEFGKIADDILKKSGVFKYAGQIVQSHDSEAAYYYDDAYFLQDAKDYNPQLATMSLCFELTSWSSYDTGNWPDKSKNARELLTGELLTSAGEYSPGTGGIGFKDFAQNEEVWKDWPRRDSIGVVAANKTITDSRDGGKKYTLIALAVRGGGYFREWSGNFAIGESGSHAGFTTAKEEVLRFLKGYITDHAITGEIKLWVVGYSRAGATANMVGGALDDGYSLPNVSLEHKNLFVYTFEAPQGALETTVVSPGHGDYSNIHNIINLNDPVPLVAPYPWGFVRYNVNETKTRLPSAETSSVFTSQRAAMLTEFDKLEGASELGYKVMEYSTKDVLKIDRSKIFPFGDPLWWWEKSKVSQRAVLVDTVDFLADDVLKSRAYYANFMEKGVSEIIGLLSKDDSGIMDKLITELAKRLDKDRFVEIIKPLFSINPYYSLDERTSDVKKNVRQFVSEVKAALGITVSLIALLDILDNLVDQFVIDILNNNTDTINLIIKLVDLANVGSLKQAHYPEICLAWLMSRDLNYNRSAIAETVPGAYRIIRINCPVDLNVYDSNNTIVASIVDDEPQDVGSSIICYINENDEKIVYLPADEDYQINIQATDDGEMTYSASEYNLTKNGFSRLINYYNVPLTNGARFTGVVDSFSTAEIENGTPDGSAVEYKLLDSSSAEIPGWEEISGADVTNNYFKVFVAPNNDSGYVDGSGTFIKGSFAKVEAMPLSGSSFLGWYIDDELVSEDATYRFAVKENVNLIAKFVPVEKHALKLNAKSGGRITSVEGFYTVGTEIAVVAEANDGYVFKNWTSSEGGTFAEANSATTTFIMPGNDVTVTANFELISSATAPSGRWKFDEGTGTAIADTSGNNNNGTIAGAAWVNGKVGKALSFDGVNDYVEIPYNSILNPKKALTIEAWINPCSTAADQRILSKSPYPNNDYSMIRASNNRVLVSMKINGTVQSIYSPANSVPVGTWTHVAGTYDGTRMRLYINGAQVNSFTVCGEIGTHVEPLMIGKNATSGYFKGMVDEVSIYNKALTAAEVLSRYQAAQN